MKRNISIFLTAVILFLALRSFLSCSGAQDNETDKQQLQLAPVSRQYSQLETEIQTAISEIEKKEIAAAGDSVLRIDIDGLEVIRYSRKKYLTEELNSQQENFKKYFDYLDRVAKNNKSMNNPYKRQESQAKHDAVVVYLEKAISKASEKRDMFKVIYYLRVVTNKIQYTQPKTTYLDSSLKKITGDYSFLSH